MLLLFTHRPEYENRWLGLPHVIPMRLEPLRQDSTLKLLDQLIGTNPSVNTLKALVASRVGGTPLFLEETVGRERYLKREPR